LSYEAAATLPTVFLTTHYAINHLARLQAGEMILIHAGTGGVGQAAIQISQHLGLEVFSTAGTPEKRQLLRDMGVPHVMDSRSLDFADEIMGITGGEGVDAVLNSLAGEFINKNFSVLAPFGRFLEIGKVDIYNNKRVGLEQLRNNISYYVIDLAQHLEQKPDFVASMFAELADRFAQRHYRPLTHQTFPIADVVEAFRYMAQGKHIGKNVLSFDVDQVPIGPCTEQDHLLRGDATYLIVGGASGFGLELAKWMTRHGGRNIVLFSRSGPRDAESAAAIAELQQPGFQIVDARGDVTQPQDVQRIVAQIQAEMPPLAGVIHGAMVLDDEFMAELDDARFNKVLHPKILGAWNLHEATRDLPLEHFICFSSFSAIAGGAKQSNYNAGNVFLDSIAHHRRSLGLPALTINWSALSGAGFVERNEKTAQYLDKLGMKSLTMEEAFAVFERMIVRDPVQIAACRADWQSLARLSPYVGNSNVFTSLVQAQQGADSGGSIKPRLLAADAQQRLALLQDFVADQVAGVFGVESNQVDRDSSLTNLGLDSLMAIDLINRIEGELGMSVPMGNVLRGPSLNELADLLLGLFADDGNVGSADVSDSPAHATSLIPIEKTNRFGDEFPLSEGQQALWFLYQLAPRSSAYNLTFSAKFRPHIDIDAMQKAFALLFKRHPMLDVTFSETDGKPVQRLRRGGTIDFREQNVEQLSEQELKELLVKHANRPFDLEHGPLIRLELFRTSEGHVSLMSMHHIISDAWSVTVLIRDLIESYFTIRSGRQPQFEPVPFGYEDFVAWEQVHLSSDAGQQMGKYWMSHIEGAPHMIDLPTDHPRPAVQSFRGATHGFKLDDELALLVLQSAASQNTTLFTLLLAAYEVLLHRYSNQPDFLVGCPMAGRQQRELHDLVGYFVNPVPLRSRVDDDPTFAEFLARTQDTVSSGLENQQYPFKRLAHRASVARDASRSPLFQVAFSMERIPGFDEQGIAVFLIGEGGHKFHLGELEMESIDLITRQSQFDILLVVEEAGGNIYGCWQYNRDLFEPETIQRLNTMYADLLAELLRDPTRQLSQYHVAGLPESKQTPQQLGSPAAVSEQLQKWNATQRPLRNELLVQEQIEQQVDRTPHATAVVCGDQQLTYQQLNSQANQLAWHLRSLGVGPDTRVGIVLDRGVSLVVSILGVLKAGGAYVPLDPSYPKSRLEHIAKSAQMRVVVTQQAHRDKLAGGCENLVCLDTDREQIESHGSDNPETIVSPDNLIYVIFTSGSTGEPKGAGVYHRGFANLIDWFINEFEIESQDRSLVVTSHGFDLTQKNFFANLIVGGELHLANCGQYDPDQILNEISDGHITLLNCTPSNFYLLLADPQPDRLALLDSLRTVFLGGEPINMSKLATWRGQQGFATEIVNTYGPTECTDICSYYRVAADSDETTIPIGYPIHNVQTYVLDDQLQALPVGVTGELCIGGVGVGAGYIDEANRNTDKFVPHPFASGKDEFLYRSGDLCRYRQDGVIEFVGRKDDQVKIRGYRIELGEIETVLQSATTVHQCAVVATEDSSANKRLTAFVVTSVGESVDEAELKQYLAEKLPSFMIPAVFVQLEQLPLTAHGKVDRLSLQSTSAGTGTKRPGYVAPRDELERELVTLWEQVLSQQNVGIRDRFFDLGGDSMMSVELMIKIRRQTGIEVPLAVLLRGDTVAEMAGFLRDKTDAPWSPVVPIQPHGDRPPLFCIHPVGGNVVCYTQLAAAMSDNQPIYGIQASGVDESTTPLKSMDAMVDAYLTAIREIQPSGSYHFAAWSSGGIIAYELARRLLEDGETVSTVALFDSFAPDLMRIDATDEATVLAGLIDFLNRFYYLNIDISHDDLSSLPSDERIRLLLDRAQQTGFVSEDFDESYMRRFLNVCQAQLQAIADYAEVQSPDVPVVLFRASDPTGRSHVVEDRWQQDLGWGSLLGRQIEVVDAGGDHVSMLTGERAVQLARDLQRLIDASAQREFSTPDSASAP
jgi:amino acid adenylation domain-containing protein